MNVEIAGFLVGGVAVALWYVACVYIWGREHRRRRWQARWDDFAVRHSRLDAELDRAWNLFRR